MSESQNHDREESSSSNQLLLESFKAMMVDMKADLERTIEQKLRNSPRPSDSETYYSQSSRSHHSRRRRPQEDREPRNPRTNSRDPLAGLKIKIPPFLGTNNPEEYLEWEKQIELVFECREYSNDSKVRVAPTAFKEYALSWWDQLVTSRRRVGDLPIDSWNQMKVIMRKRFIPSHYHRELHIRLRNLTQGNKTVEEYYKEMETLLSRADIREDSEAAMARFIGGLNREIQDRLEVHHYVELEELLHKAVMFEKQLKRRSHKSSFSKSSYPKEDEPGSNQESKPFSKPFSKPKEEDLKLKEKERPTKTREIKCFKCHGNGHYASECPNKRTIILKETGELESEDEHAKPETEDEHVVMPVSGELLVARRTLNLKAKDNGNNQRENLFHTRCNVKGKVCSVVIDGGSCTNVASETMVEKLGLKVQERQHPYKLKWLNDEGELEVKNQVLVPISIGAYEDEIMCDVLPMDAGHLLLGRPWQSDKRTLHDGFTNKYSFDFKGKKMVLVPLTPQEVYQDQLSLKKNKTPATPKDQKSNHLLIKQEPKGKFSAASPNISKYCWLTIPKQAMPSTFEQSLQDNQEFTRPEQSSPIREYTQEQVEKNELTILREKLAHSLTLSLSSFTKNFEITFEYPTVGLDYVLMQGNIPVAYLKSKYPLWPKEFIPHPDQKYKHLCDHTLQSDRAGKTDLRTNPFQVGEDDMILRSKAFKETKDHEEQLGPGNKRTKEQLEAEEKPGKDSEDVHLPFGPPKPKIMKASQYTTSFKTKIRAILSLLIQPPWL